MPTVYWGAGAMLLCRSSTEAAAQLNAPAHRHRRHWLFALRSQWWRCLAARAPRSRSSWWPRCLTTTPSRASAARPTWTRSACSACTWSPTCSVRGSNVRSCLLSLALSCSHDSLLEPCTPVALAAPCWQRCAVGDAAAAVQCPAPPLPALGFSRRALPRVRPRSMPLSALGK